MLLLTLALPCATCPGQAAAKKSDAPAAARLEPFCLVPEPGDAAPVSRPIKGAKSTVLVPARETSIGGLRYLTKNEFEALGWKWPSCLLRAGNAADRHLAGLKPEITRDAKGYVKQAVFRSRSQLTASLLLSPKLRAMFRDTMGDDLVLLIPNRFTVYVFPRAMGQWREAGPKVLEEYRDSPWPVSLEVLVLNREGISSIGNFLGAGEPAVDRRGK